MLTGKGKVLTSLWSGSPESWRGGWRHGWDLVPPFSLRLWVRPTTARSKHELHVTAGDANKGNRGGRLRQSPYKQGS